ncbi:MAG: DoxX family protein [Paludibacteraceae bacterium]|nr:DoxX family protein [Paludibacteraceae bacterium]
MDKFKHICASIARTLLGLTFVFSGFVKAVDPLGTTYKIEDYLKAFGEFFTVFLPLAEVAAICLIAFEFLLGVCLLLNIRTSVSSWLALAMMAVMTPLTLYIAIANPVTDCGCFGDAVILSNWATFWKNIVLLVLVVVLLAWKRHIPPTFSWKGECCAVAIALLAVGGFMAYNLVHLPVIDFRPFKVGNYLPDLMVYPEGAEPDEYETTFVYEKDGVEQEFTIDNYPQGDPDWHFVEQKSVLVKKGYEPPIHDFEIINYEFDDITDEVLDEESATIVVMYDLNKTRKSQAGKLVDLIFACYNTDQPLYLLTGSGEDDVEQYVDIHLQPFFNEVVDKEMVMSHFCFVDPVTLKTIVRANPGVVELRRGTVTAKYAMRDYEFDVCRLGFYDAAEAGEGEEDDYSESEEYGNSDVYTEEQDFSAEIE